MNHKEESVKKFKEVDGELLKNKNAIDLEKRNIIKANDEISRNKAKII